MDALSRTHRGFRYTVVGRFLDIHRGIHRLARFNLCPAAAEAVRIDPAFLARVLPMYEQVQSLLVTGEMWGV